MPTPGPHLLHRGHRIQTRVRLRRGASKGAAHLSEHLAKQEQGSRALEAYLPRHADVPRHVLGSATYLVVGNQHCGQETCKEMRTELTLDSMSSALKLHAVLRRRGMFFARRALVGSLPSLCPACTNTRFSSLIFSSLTAVAPSTPYLQRHTHVPTMRSNRSNDLSSNHRGSFLHLQHNANHVIELRAILQAGKFNVAPAFDCLVHAFGIFLTGFCNALNGTYRFEYVGPNSKLLRRGAT